MSFTDPLPIAFGDGPVTLPRVSTGDDFSEYMSSNGLITLKASHEYGKRTRRMIRLNTARMTADPFKPAENVKVSMSIYMVFDIPPAGYDPTAIMSIYTGFKSVITANSDLHVVKLLGGES